MAKDPAFLFYSKDWLTGTAEFLPAEKGVLIDLLSYQHQNGSLPSDPPRLARLVGLSMPEFEVIWKVISSKFYIHENRLLNRRLETVMDERAEKGLRNKIIGTFASVLRLANLSKAQYAIARKHFKADDFISVPTERLTERLTEWLAERLKSIGNGNANGNENENADELVDEAVNENATANENALPQKMRVAFEQVYRRKLHIDFSWDERCDTAVARIIGKIKNTAKCSDDATILSFWQTMLDNMPDWYVQKAFSPSTINNRFNEIFTQIHKPGVANQLTFDRQFAEIAAAGSPFART